MILTKSHFPMKNRVLFRRFSKSNQIKFRCAQKSRGRKIAIEMMETFLRFILVDSSNKSNKSGSKSYATKSQREREKETGNREKKMKNEKKKTTTARKKKTVANLFDTQYVRKWARTHEQWAHGFVGACVVFSLSLWVLSIQLCAITSLCFTFHLNTDMCVLYNIMCRVCTNTHTISVDSRV